MLELLIVIVLGIIALGSVYWFLRMVYKAGIVEGERRASGRPR
jgi:hypothetical protein